MEDPDRDEVILNILLPRQKGGNPFEVQVTLLASEMRNKTILCRKTSTISNINDKAYQVKMPSSPIIPQIPTLNLEACTASQLCDFVSETKASNFIVKPTQGAGSLASVLTKEDVSRYDGTPHFKQFMEETCSDSTFDREQLQHSRV